MRLYPYVARHKTEVVIGFITQAGMGISGTLLPLILGVITDCLTGAETPLVQLGRLTHIALGPLLPYYHPKDAHTLAVFSLALVIICAVQGVFSYWTRQILIGLSRDIEFDLRNDLLNKLVQMEPEFYVRNRTGELMSRCTNDLNSVRMVLGPGIMYTANTIATMILAVILMFWISARLSAFVLLPVPVVAITVWLFGRQIHALYGKIQASLAVLSAKAQENLAGVRVVRAYGQEEAEIRGFERDNTEYINRSLKLVRLMGMLWPTLETMLGVAIAIVLWVGGQEVLRGRISAGDFTAYLMYMFQLTWPIIALGWVINIFQRGTASMGRIAEIMQVEPEIKDEPALIRFKDGQPIVGDVEFRNLTFAHARETKSYGTGELARSHEPGKPVLKGINLRIAAGTSLAIVGPTGSGKSTLVQLIARIYDAQPGMVLIDGRPIREYSLAWLRRNIGFVPQETFLFSDTIRENIAFGAEHATDEDVRHAANVARIATEIESFPDGYMTAVGERGITLSGGQKQRTAIARAVIRDPRILVLDDALASVDTQTEDYILNHLREVMKGRTTIFISHRVSTVRNADRIAVLHDGQIVECGTHDELIAMNGYYTDLHNKQLLEEELETV